jgi:hypothetical protein
MAGLITAALQGLDPVVGIEQGMVDEGGQLAR